MSAAYTFHGASALTPSPVRYGNQTLTKREWLKVDYKNYTYPVEYKGCGGETSIKEIEVSLGNN